ncbi:MAG: hypothetical protein Tsb0017_15170 [Geothermobacteraceae bacterium]
MTLNSLHNPAYRVQISGQKLSPAPTEPATPAPAATPPEKSAPAGPDRVHISAEARMLAAGKQPEPAEIQAPEQSRRPSVVPETTEPRRIRITA